ncbi:type VI secretion system tip protein VgrG [Rubrivivax gelatinosus]|nr:type VI secretion system tip protein VgrG [Rubrivivax gelatinosus]MBK1690343.1 hypothetical protein [Rubrivivax gelatinosus]
MPATPGAMTTRCVHAADAGPRGWRFALDAPGLPPCLVLEAWAADEALDRPGEMLLSCRAPDATLDARAWLGQPLALLASAAGASPWRRCGRVVQVDADDGDGGLARYRLRVRSWFALLEHGLHSRAWRDRGLAEILADVFEPYADVARWQLADAAGALPREFTVQYRERDLDFVLRLLAAEGRTLRIDPATDTLHLLSDTRDERQCPQDPASARAGALARRRPGPDCADEAVTALERRTRLAPAGRRAGWIDPVSARVLGAAVVAGDGVPPSRQAWREGAFADAQAGRRLLQQLQDGERARARSWHGRSTVRSFAPGTWVQLGGDDAVPAMLLTRVCHAGVGDAARTPAAHPPDGPGGWPLQAPWLDPALGESAWTGGYANAFDAIEREQPWRPVGEGAVPAPPRRPLRGVVGAEVVGRDGDPPGALAADEHGRLRVRLDFQAPAVACTGASTAAATGWLRVVQPWGGAGVAAQWLPRVGQRVVVGFLDGDVERPVILAGVHDGVGEGGVDPTPGGRAAAPAAMPPAGSDHQASGQGNRVAGAHAPPWHGAAPQPTAAGGQANAAAMSGWRSRELAGEGANQLVFDDSDGALRVQLASSHAGSQLNLGWLVHQAGNRRGSARGLGFELRSDAAGVVRAGRGLLLSACAHPPGAAAADNAAGWAAARGLEGLARTLAAAAAAHRAAPSGACEPAGGSALKAACEALHDDGAGDGGRAGPAAALLAGHAPGGVVATAESLVEAAAGTLTRAAGRDLAMAAGGLCRLQAGGRVAVVAGATGGTAAQPPGLVLAAVAGGLELRSDDGDLALESRDAATLQSVCDGVELRAGRRVVLAVDGGAGIVLEGGTLRIECPGTLRVEAAARRFEPPG